MLNCSRCEAFELQVREVGLWITAFTAIGERARKGGAKDALDRALHEKEKLRSELQDAYSAHRAAHQSSRSALLSRSALESGNISSPDESPLHGNIMVVDDNPSNLKLLESMLRQQHYEAHSFPRGLLALSAAVQNPPDLIMLDINMPEMNGYDVCERLHSSAQLAGIPVIFLSDIDTTEAKIKAFRSGGIDYISKPFQAEEVQARVEAHLKLRRAQQAEHDLLERTLHGAIEALWQLVQLKSLMLALRSRAILDIVLCVTKRMEFSDPWQYESAGMLCLLGCVALPDLVIEKACGGENLSPDEDQMFRAHPESAARLLSNIPRLEVVAEMIRGQLEPDAGQSVSCESTLGAHMLHLAVELDRRIYRGVDFHTALTQLRMLHDGVDGPMLYALAGYHPTPTEFEIRRAPIRDLQAGMVLEEDVVSKDGNLLILKEGTALTRIWIERLGNFAAGSGVQELVGVRIPKFAAPDQKIRLSAPI